MRVVWQRVMPSGCGRGERALRWLALFVFVALGVRIHLQATAGAIDFDGFHAAARHVLDEGSIRDAENVARYLPHFQILHLPFALLPVGAAAVLWYVASVAALLATPRELERLSGVAPRDQWPAWLAAAPFAWANLPLGQSGPVLLWAGLFAINRVREGAGACGGAVLALVTLFKAPMAALVAAPLLLGRPVRVLAGLVATLAVCSALLVAVVGPADAWESTARWWELIRTKQSPEGMVRFDQSLRFNNQSLPITLVRNFGELPRGLHIRGATRIAAVSRPVIWTGVQLVVACLVAVGLACAARARRRGRDRESWLVVTSLSALGLLFVSPLVWTHYFIWTLPALVALRASRRAYVVWFVVAVAGLASPYARGLGAHLWMALVLYLALAWRFLRAPSPESLPPPAPGG